MGGTRMDGKGALLFDKGGVVTLQIFENFEALGGRALTPLILYRYKNSVCICFGLLLFLCSSG